MAQKKNLVEKDAGDKNIELTDAIIEKDSQGGILTVNLKNQTSNFFIKSKDVDINIHFAFGQVIKITAYQDLDETEIKELKFESVTKNKKLSIKLNKLLDGVQIQNRE